MKLKVYILTIVAITGLSCSIDIPEDVELTEMKDVFPLSIDTLNSFIGLTPEKTMEKIVSYGYVFIKGEKTLYDYNIEGYRSSENFVLDYMDVMGDKGKNTNRVSYRMEFGTTDVLPDYEIESAKEAAQKSGKSIFPREDIISYVKKVGQSYVLNSGHTILFKEVTIKDRKSETILTTDDYTLFESMLENEEAYSFKCIWESEDYVFSDNQTQGAYMRMKWKDSYDGPLQVYLMDYQ